MYGQNICQILQFCFRFWLYLLKRIYYLPSLLCIQRKSHQNFLISRQMKDFYEIFQIKWRKKMSSAQTMRVLAGWSLKFLILPKGSLCFTFAGLIARHHLVIYVGFKFTITKCLFFKCIINSRWMTLKGANNLTQMLIDTVKGAFIQLNFVFLVFFLKNKNLTLKGVVEMAVICL